MSCRLLNVVTFVCVCLLKEGGVSHKMFPARPPLFGMFLNLKRPADPVNTLKDVKGQFLLFRLETPRQRRRYSSRGPREGSRRPKTPTDIF